MTPQEFGEAFDITRCQATVCSSHDNGRHYGGFGEMREMRFDGQPGS